MHQTSPSGRERSDPRYSWPSTDGYTEHGLEATETSRLARLYCTSTRVPQRHLPISLGRRQRSWGASNAQQKPINSIWPRVEGGHECLSPTSSNSKQASTTRAYKHHLDGHIKGVKQSKLKQPTCASPLLMHARPKVYMPPERAAALLRSLSGTPGKLALRQVTDKAAMLESYLQDAHNLSREASRSCAAIGSSQQIFQDTPSASTPKSIPPVHQGPALDCTTALPLQNNPARQGSNSPSTCVKGGLSGRRWASGRGVLHDGDAAASEWEGAPSIASSMKSRATAMYSKKIGYAEMHLERIAERWTLALYNPFHVFDCQFLTH